MHDPRNLTRGARDTLNHIEHHPTTHNISWSDFLVMLKEIADVEENHDGAHIVVRLGNHRQVLERADDKPVNEKTVLEVRRMFKDAGFM